MKVIRISDLVGRCKTKEELISYLKKNLIGKDVSFGDMNRNIHREEITDVGVEMDRYIIFSCNTVLGIVHFAISVIDDITIHNFERLFSELDQYGEEDWDD